MHSSLFFNHDWTPSSLSLAGPGLIQIAKTTQPYSLPRLLYTGWSSWATYPGLPRQQIRYKVSYRQYIYTQYTRKERERERDGLDFADFANGAIGPQRAAYQLLVAHLMEIQA